MRRWLALLAACGAQPVAPKPPIPVPRSTVAVAPVTQEETLAAIQKAMNDLKAASQQCWAKIATERFDIEGDYEARIAITDGGATVEDVKETVHNPKLLACMRAVLAAYPWAPPLRGQTIQLPFQWRAPDGQNVIDRALIGWAGQGQVSVSVLLDENNTGNDMLAMFEVAIDGATGLRVADRAELWYFLGAAKVTDSKGGRDVAAGDMMFVPAGAARDVAGDLHAMVAAIPGGREGSARGGALPTPPADAAKGKPPVVVLPQAGARAYGPVRIFLEDKRLAASLFHLAAGGQAPEHVHANETEALYVLAGTGTLTVNGVAQAVTPTSVVQIPRGARHAFAATTDFTAVQLYTPGGPEQRFKK